MRTMISFGVALAAVTASVSARATDSNLAKPELRLQQVASGMPREEKQEVRVLTATFKPGERTVYHTHPFPVTVYVLEGAFTLELDGREPIILKAGEALVEPPHVAMKGYNRSVSEPTKVVIFYVSDPGAPFLNLHH